MQEYQFETEVQDLLHLMVHSLYSNKDIFLRELISNASDACDKRRFEALTDAGLSPASEFEIRLEADKTQRTLQVSDNGIGMSKDELIKNLGTIARSGTKEFVQALKDSKGADGAPENLIGQFGVGFYASFMVADRVEVVSKKAGQSDAHRWISSGDGKFSIEEASRAEAGTTVILHLKPSDDTQGVHDYTDSFALRGIVKRHSDFVSYPIRMKTERQEPVLDDEGKPVVGAVPKLVVEDTTLNSQQAIWTRPKSEVADEEYTEFYRHVSGDWGEPAHTISTKMEGMFEATLLLFIPKQAPWDLYQRDRLFKGIQLFVKRIFIMDECKELIPEWLRFIKGVVDSEDLSLNVSREILQQDRQVKSIRKFLVKRVLDALQGLKKDEAEKYQTFWQAFGPVLKEGLADSSDPNSRDRLLELVMAQSSAGDELTDLEAYVDRMKDDQTSIYYLTGSSLEAMRQSPHLEGFVADGYEVLFLHDHVDEFWVSHNLKFKDFDFVSIGKGTFDASDKSKNESEKSEETEGFKPLVDALRRVLQEEVKEVRLSSRLKDSPACLVGDTNDMTPQMASLLRQMGQEVPKTKRILELNPGHVLVQKMLKQAEVNPKDDLFETYAEVLHGQCVLAEAGSLDNPAAFAKKVAQVMASSDAFGL